MAGAEIQSSKPLRVFAHYVLGRLMLLFFFCHPGTLATFSDGQAYLLNRYPNRDLVTMEGQLQDQRRHVTPRSPDDFNMRTGVPEEFLHGDADNWTPDWAPSLEERFHNTVKAWLRRGSAVARRAQDTAAAAAAEAATPPGMAFVPSRAARAEMDIRQARANDRQKQRWMSLSELGAKRPRSDASRVVPALARGGGGHRSGHYRGSCPHGMQMLLGFRSRGGLPSRRRFPGFISKNDGSNNVGVLVGNKGANGDDVNAAEVTAEAVVARTLAAPARRTPISNGGKEASPSLPPTDGAFLNDFKNEGSNNNNDIFSSLLGGAADAYDSAVSFVGCALVTSPLGKRYLNAYDEHNTVPASAIRGGVEPMAMGGSSYNLVGFSNIDPYVASARRGGGSSNRLLQ